MECVRLCGVLPVLRPPFPAHCVAQSAFPLFLGSQSLCLSYLTHPLYEGIPGDSAVSSEGVWVLCSQPQGAEESQLFLCGHVWSQQLGHQPPGPHLGGKCPGSAKARPLPSLGMLGWLSLPSHGLLPVLPSQRLPHKVRKLYSALERMLVSAGLIPPFLDLALGLSCLSVPSEDLDPSGLWLWELAEGVQYSDRRLVVYFPLCYSWRGHLPWM